MGDMDKKIVCFADCIQLINVDGRLLQTDKKYSNLKFRQKEKDLASGMKNVLRLIHDDKFSECYLWNEDGCWKEQMA